MAVPRINIKSIDYFKFKKVVIDGNRDDYNACDEKVKSFCDSVQTLNFRDEEFDDVSDRGRFEEICSSYRQILASKRIDPMDMRIKSGWWGDHRNAYSAGKLKPGVLKDTLIEKATQWTSRYGDSSSIGDIQTTVEGPGLYVLKHKEHQCFQFVGRADRIFARFAERLKMAFEGSVQEPLASLVVISMATDWDFYFIPVGENDDERVLRILENDLILKHDSIWPHGLNFRLHIDSLLEVSEFRKSCLRHRWPPDSDVQEDEAIDLKVLRKQVESQHSLPAVEEPSPTPTKTSKKRGEKDAKVSPDETDRPASAVSSATGMTSVSRSSDKPASAKSANKTGSQRPTTPKRKPGPASKPQPATAEVQNGTEAEDEAADSIADPQEEPSHDEESETMDHEESDTLTSVTKSHSGSSISSADTGSKASSAEGTPKKSPAVAKKGSKPKTAPAKSKQDKSRLPVVSAQQRQ